MCAAKTELPSEHWVQLTDFQASPKFPQRSSLSPERNSDEAGDVLTELPPTTVYYETQYTPDPSSCSNSTTDELLKPNISSRRSSALSVDTSGYSSRPESPSKSPQEKDVAVVSGKGSRKFYVTAKDATVLGRISHKAVTKRSTRVMDAHELFVELEELKSSSEEGRASLEWEETARWIKFEEDVEDSAGRWGRPHVSALTFHSLVELRKGLEQGSVMLGLEGDSYPDIVDRIVDQMVADEQLSQDRVDPVRQALYKRHRHQHQVTIWDEMKKAARSADGTLHHLGDQLRNRYHHGSHSHLPEMKVVLGEEPNGEQDIEKRSEENGDGNDKQNGASHIKLSSSVQDLLDKIPDGAESITVLVGGVDFLKEPVVVFVRLAQSHLLGDLTEVPIPVRFLYLLLGPEQMFNYHEIGRAMATLMSDKCFHDMAYSALSRDELLDAMDQFLDDSIVLPPGDWDQDLILPLMHERTEKKRKKERWLELQQSPEEEHDPTRCSRRPCGGLWQDVKRLVRRYPSDIKDVLHIQCFLSMFFIFISCVAPAIAFGGLMEEVTHNQIGETETLVGTGLCGIVFSLLGVQPLAIIAFTGPLLLFEEIIIEFAEQLQIEYLPWRACIGLWLMLIVIAFAITESTFLVKNFSRFSEEIFSGVIALFFTVEAGRTLVNIYWRNPLCGISYPCGAYANRTNNCLYRVDDMNGSGSGMDEIMMNATVPQGFMICNQPNTALWSTILCLSTFAIAVILRKLRQSRLLGKQARRLVSDFGMLTAISTMVVVSVLLRDVIAIETIVVSENYQLTNSTARGWFINPVYNLSVAEIIGAVVPAALLGLLIFIENQLALLLVNRPDHKLKKGVGYHLDLVIVGVLGGVCGVMGLPWHCAAAIRSIQHVQSLSVYSNKNAPGEKPTLIHIYEQRVTNFVIHFLIILTPFAAIVLKEIPFSVLLGVFLYLMYASFSGIQLRKRIKLLFTPPKHHPDIHYIRKVRTWKMNIYTVIQVVLIALLYGLKLSQAGMLYPVAIVLLIPIRMFMEKFMYTHKEFEALNGEEDHPEDYEAGDIDFPEYQETHVPY